MLLKPVARLLLAIAFLLTCPRHGFAGANLEILNQPSRDIRCISLAGNKNDAVIVVDTNDYPVVQLAAELFAEDVRRVTGHRPAVTNAPLPSPQWVIAGTLGHSAFVDQLAAAGKLKDVDKIQGRWETTLLQVVQQPFPGVDRALVIAGSDRRGTAYGLIQLSEQIGISPWHWWADVPVRQQDALTIKLTAPQTDSPGVKYRGIFINDEDWGLYPWAAKTFDPKFGNIGPKTYEKVFELMLRLRLNYLWPAMHACSAEFGSAPENVALADKFAIVAGSSHCEPMLCNNVHWNEKEQGPWNYSLNRDAIHSYWEENVKARGNREAVWTLGIRGIHDAAMEQPPAELPRRISLVDQVIRDQRAMLDQHVSRQWGSVAQCFVPYKEVLPIYDAGLTVPDDVTLVWVDDNFGYIRRLSSLPERQRSGGAGVYWHLSYYGGPHSYTWINTTAPALMWEELHKAWENNARNLWVINVGDIKPMETGIDYFSRFAWNPDGFSLGAQRAFLHDFWTRNFGEQNASKAADFLMEFYRLGTIRKPELMNRDWVRSLAPDDAAQLAKDYENLLQRETSLSEAIPATARDAYVELIGFPARVLGTAGLIFMADRAGASELEIGRLRNNLQMEVTNFNTHVAGGKWNRMMPGLVTGKDLAKWSSQVRWPWGESESSAIQRSAASSDLSPRRWRAAASADRQRSQAAAHWNVIEGLGPSGRAMALQPVIASVAWQPGDTNAPALEYDFKTKGGDAVVKVDFLPTFRIFPGMKLRVAASVDNQAPMLIEVPGSSGAETENGTVRSKAVQDNYVRASVPLAGLAAGKHTLRIQAIDPGIVIDRIFLP